MITSSDLLNIYSWFLASISMGVRMTSFFIARSRWRLTALQGSNLLLSLRKFAIKDRQRRNTRFTEPPIAGETPEQNFENIDDSVCLTTFFE